AGLTEDLARYSRGLDSRGPDAGVGAGFTAKENELGWQLDSRPESRAGPAGGGAGLAAGFTARILRWASWRRISRGLEWCAQD
ncbi:hypothetical protein TIFTF001_049318, partial [Ficus carica]